MLALVAPEVCQNVAGVALGHCPAPADRPSVRLQGPQHDIVSGAAEGRAVGWCPEVSKAAPAGEAAPWLPCPGGRAACLHDG